MGKNKLKKFSDNAKFDHVIEPHVKEFVAVDHELKGNWHSLFFKNNNPIVLELGCGKGEYSVNLAQKFPDKNFIGVDIKGARLWLGAKTSHEKGMKNIAFLRTRIELINSYFAPNEVAEIWVTFPDPQPKHKKYKVRLTGSVFLSNYQKLLIDNGIVHLKTDSRFMYNYTVAVAKINNLEVLKSTNNLYASNYIDDVLSIKTHYEKLHIDDGETINYIEFKLDKNKKLIEPDVSEYE